VILPDSGVAGLLARPASWFGDKGGADDVVIASRVRLVRNLAGRPFPGRAGDAARLEVRQMVREAARRSGFLAGGAYWPGEDLTPVDRAALAERRLVSPGWGGERPGSGVVVDPGQSLSLAVNGGDHLSFQSLVPGFDLIEAFRMADQLDDQLAALLGFAFDDTMGFLAADPGDAGTGLRASALLHLPALVLTGALERAGEAAAESGAALAPGWSGAAGDLFVAANRSALGSTELEIIELVERAVRQIADRERRARQQLAERARAETEDKAWRASAILSNARILGGDEHLNLCSAVRLGLALGLAGGPALPALNRLLAETGPAHLQLRAGRALDAREIDQERAGLARREFGAAGRPRAPGS